MPGMNRFYNPSQSNYQSQFVPKNLPVDLMAKSLYAKQARADQMLAATVELADWKQAALEGHDTEYVSNIKNELEGFLASAMNEDRTSPEFQRKYLALTNKVKKDENLLKVQASVDRDMEHSKRVKALKEKGDHASAVWLDEEYRRSREKYTAEGGLGFKGDPLADPTTMEGNDLWTERTKYFKELKDSGSESIKYLSSGIAFKTGWDGISEPRIKKQLQATFDDYLDTNAGKEDFTKNLYEMGMVGSEYAALSKDEKETVQKKVLTNMQNDFLEAGLTYVHGKATTNQDGALNAGRTEDLEKTAGVVIPTTEKVMTEPATPADRDKQIQQFENTISKVSAKVWEDNNRVKNGLASNYTPEAKAAMTEQLASLRRQKNNLTLDKNEDYQNISIAQKKKVVGQFNAINKEQQQILASLKGKVPDSEYNTIAELLTTKLSNGNSSLYGTSQIMDEIYQNLSVKDGGVLKATLGKIKALEAKKETLSDKARNDTNALWAAAYQQPGDPTTSTQMSGASVRQDKLSTMYAINQDVVNNSEGYNFYDANGKPLHFASIKSFNGSNVTSGNFRDKKDFGMSGSMVVRRQRVDNGVPAVTQGGTPIYEEVTIPVNVVPQGAHTQFLRNNFANEQFEVAKIKEREGKQGEAAVARAHAMSLNNASRYDELTNFNKSNSQVTSIATPMYTSKGDKAGTAEFLIKKIGDIREGGGILVKYGVIEETLNDMNEVNAYMQTITNATPQQY
jgi:hypothetical protein